MARASSAVSCELLARVQDEIQGGSDGNDWTALTDIRRDTDSVSLCLSLFQNGQKLAKLLRARAKVNPPLPLLARSLFTKHTASFSACWDVTKGRDASLFWDVFQILLVVVVFLSPSGRDSCGNMKDDSMTEGNKRFCENSAGEDPFDV